MDPTPKLTGNIDHDGAAMSNHIRWKEADLSRNAENPDRRSQCMVAYGISDDNDAWRDGRRSGDELGGVSGDSKRSLEKVQLEKALSLEKG